MEMVGLQRVPQTTKALNVTEALVYNLRHLMHVNGITEAELSRQTTIPQPTLHKILTGRTEDPRASTLKLLADYFVISMDELFGFTFPHTSSKPQIQSIPIISWSDCLIERNKVLQHSHVLCEFIANTAYALVVKPSMTPRFPLGATLIINPNYAPQDGNLVVVHYSNTPEATLRELVIDGSDYKLLPINEKTTSTGFDKNTKILGVLVKYIVQMEH